MYLQVHGQKRKQTNGTQLRTECRRQTCVSREIYNKMDPQINGEQIVQMTVVIQLLSHPRLFATPWTTAHQASLLLSAGVCSNLRPLSR